jgi:hypothetical protein
MSTVILGIVGALVSLLFSYYPPLKVWYGNQKNNGLIMVGFVLVVSAAYFGLSCTSLAAQLNLQVACTQAGAVQMFYGFLGCLTGNQLAYLVSGESPTPTVTTTKG